MDKPLCTKKPAMITDSGTIVGMWHALEDDDHSTEKLLAMVSDACGIDIDDVVTALQEEGVFK